MNTLNFKNLLFFSICAIGLLSLVLYLPLQNHKVFESPDENANYLTTKLYAETGQLWYIEEYTELDIENYLHPRHFVTYEGRIVPTQFWGLPVVYGTLYRVAGDYTAIIFTVVFSLLSFVFFVKLASLLFGRKSGKYAALLFIANLPLLFYFSLPYFNAAGAITFFIGGLFYLARFSRLSHTGDLLLASLIFSLSIFFRLEYIIFIAIVFAITLLNKYRTRLRSYVKPAALATAIIFLFAIVPILVLNREVYGDALTSGYKLLEAYSIERESTRWWQFILPNPVIPDVIAANVYRLIYRLLPLVTLLSVLGVTFYIRNRKLDGYKLLYGVLFVYILIYSGSSDTFNAFNFSYLGFNTAIMRYWLMAYVFLALIAVEGFLFLEGRYKRLVPLLTMALVVTFVSGLLIDNERSIVKLSGSQDSYQRIAETIQAEIDERSFIYLDTYDKVFNPYGMRVATWWAQKEGYDPSKLANSMERIHQNTDYSVYLYARSHYIEVKELNDILERENLSLESHQEIRYLYKLKAMSP